jgi:carbamoyltransferase
MALLASTPTTFKRVGGKRSIHLQMSYWGINALNHGSSLAVFAEYDLKSWQVSKENTLPSEVIKQALNQGGPDKIFWYERPWVKKARQLYAGQYRTAFNLNTLPGRYLKQTRLDYADVYYSPHHASHAAAGYYTSPFNHAAIVVLDAIGEFECATIWEGKCGELRKVWSKSYPHSLGLFYSAFTKLCSLEPIKQEHLLQEMALNGDPTRYYFDVKEYMGTLIHAHKNLHRGVLDWPHDINNIKDQCDIAAAVQEVFTEQVDSIMRVAKELTGADCLVYMGGCAMNSAANKIVVEPKFKYTWSLPQPGDPSSSIGAVLYHTKWRVDWRYDIAKHIAINT